MLISFENFLCDVGKDETFSAHNIFHGWWQVVCFSSCCCNNQLCIRAYKYLIVVATKHELAYHLFIFFIWSDVLRVYAQPVPAKGGRLIFFVYTRTYFLLIAGDAIAYLCYSSLHFNAFPAVRLVHRCDNDCQFIVLSLDTIKAFHLFRDKRRGTACLTFL
jgi:hypothetical protein